MSKTVVQFVKKSSNKSEHQKNKNKRNTENIIHDTYGDAKFIL